MSEEAEDPHSLFHFREAGLCLFEEAVDDAAAEFSVVFIVVHFEDLFERLHVEMIAETLLRTRGQYLRMLGKWVVGRFGPYHDWLGGVCFRSLKGR